MDISKIREDLILKEGIRYKAYADPILGEIAMTTACGHLIKLPEEEYLLEKELTMDEVMELLDNDIQIAITGAKKFINLEEHPDAIQETIVSLVFNMGLPRLQGFRKMKAALEAKDYVEAHNQLLDSKYARQLPHRAKDYAEKIRDA
tara:strand:+ start:285 stop:725 length:441 start_codon:yes stop_codon:yes gene_type:complete